MSDRVVQYELSLKDGLSPKVDEVTGHVNRLEHGLHSVRERGMEMLTALGVGFAIFKGIEFVHEGVEAMHQLEQSVAQVEAGLKSTKNAAGLTFEDVEKSAKSLAKELPYSRAAILDMQAQLLTFPAITKHSFNEASEAVLDMASRTHRGANEIAIMLGKALQDPEHGITAMRRVGVNFNDTQTAIIKKMVETGHTAQAQSAILKELSLEFGGSAKAAAEADPLFKFNKLMGSIKMEVGEVAMKLLHELTPALEAIANGFKATFEWMKEHKDLLKAIAIGVGVAAAAWVIYEVVTNASTIATNIFTAAQAALNAVMAASPITWIIIGLGVLVTAVVYCYNHFAKFRAVLWGVWETIKEFGRLVGDVFMGVGKVIAGVLTLKPSLVTEGFHQTLDAISNAGNRLGSAFKKGYDDGMADFTKEQKDKESLIPKKVAIGAAAATGTTAKEPKTKATGSKSVTINVSIKDLIGVQNINTTNLKEGAAKIKDLVVQALSGAVNDFQIVADH